MLWDFAGREGVAATGSSISAARGSADMRRAVDAEEATMGLLGAKAVAVPARAEKAKRESFMIVGCGAFVYGIVSFAHAKVMGESAGYPDVVMADGSLEIRGG